MKVAKSAFNDFDRKVQTSAILPLLDEEQDEDDKTKIRSFKLLTNPTQADSPKFSLSITVLDENASVRAAIKWRTAINKILTGLNLTTGNAKHPVIQELATGAPLQSYNTGTNANRAARHVAMQVQAVQAAGNQNPGETNDAYAARLEAARSGVNLPDFNHSDIESGLNAVMLEICPYKALEKQKRFMRRKMRKPANLSTRAYVSNILRINGEELPMLPPFQANQSLSADEIIDIVTFGIPKSWVRKMDEHDFDPLAKGLGSLVAFCERMEAAEEHQNDSETKGTSSKKTSKKHKSTRNNGGKGKWCEYHETDSHNTSECEVLKKLKASKGDSKPPYKNKTWKRKSDDAKSLTKKELNAIARKAGAAAIKKAQRKAAECNAINKRKSDSDDESGSDDDSVHTFSSVNMLEKSLDKVDKQLADFDFEDAKSEGEISC